MEIKADQPYQVDHVYNTMIRIERTEEDRIIEELKVVRRENDRLALKIDDLNIERQNQDLMMLKQTQQHKKILEELKKEMKEEMTREVEMAKREMKEKMAREIKKMKLEKEEEVNEMQTYIQTEYERLRKDMFEEKHLLRIENNRLQDRLLDSYKEQRRLKELTAIGSNIAQVDKIEVKEGNKREVAERPPQPVQRSHSVHISQSILERKKSQPCYSNDVARPRIISTKALLGMVDYIGHPFDNLKKEHPQKKNEETLLGSNQKRNEDLEEKRAPEEANDFLYERPGKTDSKDRLRDHMKKKDL